MEASLMKKLKGQFILGLSLAAISAVLYFAHFLIFRDAYHIYFYLLGDLAFLPIEVLLVTLVIDRVLSVREKKSMLNKLNMVIGAFFSEVGSDLLHSFSRFDLNSQNIKKEFISLSRFSNKDFDKASAMIFKFKYSVNSKAGDINSLKIFLSDKRAFMLRLLENPNLLEHEKFTELLWAVFHLTEELECRPGFDLLPEADFNHLSGDIKRAYILLIQEWLAYIKHLKNNYPYLYSLASRLNPFEDNPSPIII
jgi:hypothetical protein